MVNGCHIKDVKRMNIFKRKEKEEVISTELIAENKDYRIYKCNNRDTYEHIGYLLHNTQDGDIDLFRGTLQDFGEYIASKYNFTQSFIRSLWR